VNYDFEEGKGGAHCVNAQSKCGRSSKEAIGNVERVWREADEKE